MKYFNRFKNVSLALSVAFVAIYVKGMMNDWFKGFSNIWSNIWAFLIIAFTYFFFNYCLLWLFDHWKFLRRTFLRKEYLEGFWLCFVKPNDDGPFIGFCEIEYKEGKLLYHGHNTSLSGDNAGHFDSNLTSFVWPNLSYKYTWTDDNMSKSEGFGTIQFQSYGSKTHTLSGQFFDANSNKHYRITGIKLSEKKGKKFQSSQTRLELIREYNKEIPKDWKM